MATQRIQSSFTSPSVTFYMDADLIQTDTANRRWLIRAYLRMSKGTANHYDNAGAQYAMVNGVVIGTNSRNPFLPSNITSWNTGPYDYWVYANSQGYWSGTSTTIPLQMRLDYGNIDNTASGSMTLPRIGTVPPAPSPVAGTPDQITPTSMRYQFSSNGDGGSNIIRWEYRYSTTPDFSSGTSAWITSSGTSLVTGLTPGTQYYLQSRGVNGIGDGPASVTSTGTTLTLTAPGLAVVPQPSGASAVVGLTPPPEISNPDAYRLEYRLVGGSTVPLTVTTSPYTVTGLTPGATYEWRAAAISGSYVGPFTAWESHAQPQPSLDSGGYFDGDFPDRTDVTYSWESTVNNSKSFAYGVAPRGWDAFPAVIADGFMRATRVTGGHSGTFATRIDVISDCDPSSYAGTAYRYVAGVPEGVFPADVGGVTAALIYINPSRTQRVAARIEWFSAGGSNLGWAQGPDVIAPAGVWTALRVPPTDNPGQGVTQAGVSVIDVQGDGWSAWKAGDYFLIDDAIAPFNDYYFDGNTPDTAQYDYVWDGEVNASSSSRMESTVPATDPLVDPDCPPVPLPPRPPAIADSCVEDEVTTWRQFWAEILWSSVPEWTDAVPIMHVQAKTDLRLVRIRYYQNPFRRALSDLNMDEYCNEQIISFIPAGATLTLDGVSQRVWADVSGTPDSLAADNLLYRGNGDVPVWPVLGCGSGYFITVDVPSETPQGAVAVSYELVPRYT